MKADSHCLSYVNLRGSVYIAVIFDDLRVLSCTPLFKIIMLVIFIGKARDHRVLEAAYLVICKFSRSFLQILSLFLTALKNFHWNLVLEWYINQFETGQITSFSYPGTHVHTVNGSYYIHVVISDGYTEDLYLFTSAFSSGRMYALLSEV